MIDLILREDVTSLGKAGQMVRVKPGYARNFLLPRGLAFEATDGNKKRIAAESKARTAKASSERAEADALAARIGAISLSFKAKAGEDGKLFGSITASDIAEQLAAEGVTIDRRKIELEHPLKQLGFHSVPVRLHHDVHAELKVNVAAQG
ncbi:MAG TPA: 50S ribosomal protein L9 [Gemmatimonadales bacterium]|jgi:large subunit ribosomal protein L9|nr:50S ribosomal protein L9 [Gemmatimonadales bacterium]